MNENATLLVSDDLDEAPIWTDTDFTTAIHREGLKPISKCTINISLDQDLVEWFKLQAGGHGYQTLINAALREVVQHRSIEDVLRRVIREELRIV